MRKMNWKNHFWNTDDVMKGRDCSGLYSNTRPSSHHGLIICCCFVYFQKVPPSMCWRLLSRWLSLSSPGSVSLICAAVRHPDHVCPTVPFHRGTQTPWRVPHMYDNILGAGGEGARRDAAATAVSRRCPVSLCRFPPVVPQCPFHWMSS